MISNSSKDGARKEFVDATYSLFKYLRLFEPMVTRSVLKMSMSYTMVRYLKSHIYQPAQVDVRIKLGNMRWNVTEVGRNQFMMRIM